MRRFLIIILALLISTAFSASLAACRQVPEGGSPSTRVSPSSSPTLALSEVEGPTNTPKPTETPTPTAIAKPTETPTPTPVIEAIVTDAEKAVVFDYCNKQGPCIEWDNKFGVWVMLAFFTGERITIPMPLLLPDGTATGMVSELAYPFILPSGELVYYPALIRLPSGKIWSMDVKDYATPEIQRMAINGESDFAEYIRGKGFHIDLTLNLQGDMPRTYKVLQERSPEFLQLWLDYNQAWKTEVDQLINNQNPGRMQIILPVGASMSLDKIELQ